VSALVCVMPRASDAWASAAAMWVTAAGWAAAGRRRFGAGWVVTPDGIAHPEEALSFTKTARPGLPPSPTPASTARSPVRAWIPQPVVTAAKDARSFARARRYMRHLPAGPWQPDEVAFVWQHHDLFHRAGERLASDLGCPLVSYVHAPQVWEGAAWGVRRPGWAAALERWGEAPQLRASEVAVELERLGVDRRRVVVAPMAVDPEVFDPHVSGDRVRRRYGLGDRPVIGWAGSFRRFHGLEQALDAFARIHQRQPETRLLLVGDGRERPRLAARVHDLGLQEAVVFTGAIGHTDVPAHVAAMDVAVVTARADEAFHYSPLKMREYMSMGRPVVGPRVGEVARVVGEASAGALYEPGDVDSLATELLRLLEDMDERAALGAAGRTWIQAHGTWDVQLERLVAHLASVPRAPRPRRP
jgi:glycosyltransferase involved in cell wall biosynthesis